MDASADMSTTPPRPLSYDVVDVFTDRAFAGNPLAVVYGAESLSADQMQDIAAEFNLSETTFPLPMTEEDVAAGADYRLRIFTPDGEIPFAGHPTLGTAWALRQRGLIQAGDCHQSCRAGLIGVRLPDDASAAVELSADPHDAAHALTDDEADAVARLVSLTAADLVGPAHTAGCGLSWLYLPVRDDRVVAARATGVRVSETGLDTSMLQDPLDGVCVYAVSTAAPGGQPDLAVHARVFVPGYGIPEDPATGSAAAGLGLVLVAAGLAAAEGQTSYLISQGLEMGRPSFLHCRVEARDGVAVRSHVAGQVVATATGTIAVPGR